MINNDKLVSVIVPLYNADKYISETIYSVLAQTYSNLEIIVVDDCSTDSSRDIVLSLAEEDSRIKLVKLDENYGGPAKPRNIGIDMSNGEYIAFLDADDVWKPEKIEKQMTQMLKNKLNLISNDTYFIDADSCLIESTSRRKKTESRAFTIKDLIISNRIPTSSVLVNKSFLGELRFREEKHFKAVEDYVLWLNLINLSDCRYEHFNDPLVGYRVLANSISHQNGKLKYSLKTMSAASQFLYETNNENLFLYLLLSNALRFIKFKVNFLIKFK